MITILQHGERAMYVHANDVSYVQADIVRAELWKLLGITKAGTGCITTRAQSWRCSSLVRYSILCSAGCGRLTIFL